MHGTRRNNAFLVIYISIAGLLLASVIFFSRQQSPVMTGDATAHPEIGQYDIGATVVEVATTSRAFVIHYENEPGPVLVGLLPEAEILDRALQPVDITELRSGQYVRIRVKFIGTNSILATQVRLVD